MTTVALTQATAVPSIISSNPAITPSATISSPPINATNNNNNAAPTSTTTTTTTMSQDEMKSCRVFFNNFDRSKSGAISQWELQIALEAMGHNPVEEEVRGMVQVLAPEKAGYLDFTQFLKAIQMQREYEKRSELETDFLGAFIAMGGASDRTGSVSCDRLRKVIKEDFALTLKIDELLEDLDTEMDGVLSYGEFRQVFS